MELNNVFIQNISQILTDLSNSVIELDHETASYECKRVLYHHLFLIYLHKDDSSSFPIEIFSYNEKHFNKKKLDLIIQRLIEDSKKNFSTFFTSYEVFSSFINELQQHFMSSKDTGSVFTPPVIVKYMVKEIIKNYFKDIDFEKIKDEIEIFDILKPLKILDPSMGTGIFLVEILNQLSNFVITRLSDKIDIDPISIKTFILKNCLYGVELDLLSLDIARLLLLINVNDAISIDYIKTNFIQANTLVDPVFSDEIKGFSIIIGNPPYIRSDVLVKTQPELFEIYKNRYKEVIKIGQKSDMYFYFIKQSIELLKNGGFLSLIIPNRFLTNIYAERMREFMLKNLELVQIVDFSEFQDAKFNRIFKNIEVFPSIFLAQKSLDSSNIIMKQPRSIKELNNKGIEISQQKFVEFDNLIVISNDKKKISILDNLLDKSKFIKLGSLVSIGEGLRGITISKNDYEELNLKEKELYVKEIRGKNIRKYYLDGFNGYYKLKKEKKYYETILDQIKKNPVKKLHITNEVEQFLNKIVISEMGSELRAVLIESGEFAYGGTYYTTKNRSKIDLSLLIGIFNSSLINWLFNLIYKSTKWGTSFKFRASYLEKIPFPILNEKNSTLIKKIKAKVKEILSSETKDYINNNLDELNELIFELYEIPFDVLE